MVLNKSSVFNTLIQIFTIHKPSHNQRNGCYHSPNIPSVYFPKYQLHILPYLRFKKKILQPNFLCSDDRMISSDFHIRFFLFTGLLKDEANHDHPKGVSLRWAINTDGEGGVQLLLQTLPALFCSTTGQPSNATCVQGERSSRSTCRWTSTTIQAPSVPSPSYSARTRR